jgi:hypothetical protein
MIDGDYYPWMGAALKTKSEQVSAELLSESMLQFVDHLAELLADEFAMAMKEESYASSSVCAVLEREPKGAEH